MKLKEATYFPDAEELTRFGFVEDSVDFIGKLIGDDPLKAHVSDRLKRFGFDEPKMISILTTPEIKGVPESAVIIRTEKIKSGGIDENGETQKDEFQVSYKVPKKDLQRGIKGVIEKLRDIYIKLFENHIVEGTVLNEDGEGATNCAGVGGESGFFGYDAPAPGKKKSGKQDEEKDTNFSIISRDIYKVTESKKMKRPVGRLTMFITEAQMRELEKLLREEAVVDTAFGNFGFDAPVGDGKNNKGNDFYKEANSRDGMLTREKNTAKWNKNLEEGDSGIHIKKKNKGKFTATKKRTGKSTSELLHSPNKKTRARANFARMAKRGWKPLKDE
jgi:hypothetical protein